MIYLSHSSTHTLSLDVPVGWAPPTGEHLVGGHRPPAYHGTIHPIMGILKIAFSLEAQMPNYRRTYIPGSTVFLTLVTFDRTPLFSKRENVQKLRQATAKMRAEMPVEITGAMILPDHIHFLWTLPHDDDNYSKRVGRLKVLFTQALRGKNAPPKDVSVSRQRHRESNVWQRRFWEHTIRDQADWEQHLHYLHYNPVKHGLATCPHQWPYSSFRWFVRCGFYSMDWGCSCGSREIKRDCVNEDLVVGE